MPLMDIATGRVIEEVKLRPAIWDTTSPYYKNKQARQRAWMEVFHALVPDFDRMPQDQQAEVDRAIQQRWKTARDAYMRTKAIIKSGTLIKKYFYYDHCSFLEKNGAAWYEPKPPTHEASLQKKRKLENSVQVQPSTSSPASPSIDSSLSNDTDSNAAASTSNVVIKQEPDTVEDNIQNILEENYNDHVTSLDISQLHTELDMPLEFQCVPENPVENTNTRKTTKKLPKNFNFEIYGMLKETTTQLKNDNMSFFMSLLPIVDKFSDRHKLLFRSEVIKVLMELSSKDKDD